MSASLGLWRLLTVASVIERREFRAVLGGVGLGKF